MLFAIVAVLVLVGGFLALLHSRMAARFVAGLAGDRLGRPVALGRIVVGGLDRLYLEDLVIGIAPGSSGSPDPTPTLRIGRVVVAVLERSVEERALVLGISLDRVAGRLERGKDGRLSIEDLVARLGASIGPAPVPTTGPAPGAGAAGTPVPVAPARGWVRLASLRMGEWVLGLEDRVPDPPLAVEVGGSEASLDLFPRGGFSAGALAGLRPGGVEGERPVAASLKVAAHQGETGPMKVELGAEVRELAWLAAALSRGAELPLSLEWRRLGAKLDLELVGDGRPGALLPGGLEPVLGRIVLSEARVGVSGRELTGRGEAQVVGRRLVFPDGFELRFDRETTPLRVGGDLLLAAPGRVEGSLGIEGRGVDLGPWLGLASGRIPEGLGIEGRTDLDLELGIGAALEVRSLEVGPRGVVVRHPMIPGPVRIGSGTITGNGSRVEAGLPLELGGIRTRLAAALAPPGPEGRLDLRLEVEPFGFGEIAPLLPESLARPLAGARPRGQVRASLAASGALPDPDLRFEVRPEGLEVAPAGGLPPVRVSGKGLSGSRSGAILDVRVEAGGVFAEVDASLSPLARDGRLKLVLDAPDVAVDTVVALVPGLPARLAEAAGRLGVGFNWEGPVPASVADLLARGRGKVSGKGISGRVLGTGLGPAPGFPVQVAPVGAELAGGAVTVRGLEVSAPWGKAGFEGRLRPEGGAAIEVDGVLGLDLRDLASLVPERAGMRLSTLSLAAPVRARWEAGKVEGSLRTVAGKAGLGTPLGPLPLAIAAGEVSSRAQRWLAEGLEVRGPGLEATGRAEAVGDRIDWTLQGWVEPGALPPSFRPGVASAKGRMAVSGQGKGRVEDLASATLRVEPAGLSIRPAAIPVDLAVRSGRLELGREGIVTEDLEIEGAGAGRLQIAGRITPETTKLTVEGKALAAAPLLAVAPGQRPLQGSGMLDLRVFYQGPTLAEPADRVKGLAIRVVPLGLGLSYPMPTGPMAVTVEGGDIVFKEGVLEFPGTRLATREGRLSLRGRVEPLATPMTGNLTVTPEGFGIRFGPLTEPLVWESGPVELRPDRIELSALRLRLGKGTSLGVTGRVASPGVESRFEDVEVTGRLELAEVQAATGMDPLRSYRGPVEVRAKLSGTPAAFVAQGTLTGAGEVAMEYSDGKGGKPFRVPVDSLKAPFRFHGTRFTIDDLSARLYGGSLEAGLAFDFGKSPFEYQVAWNLAGAELGEFASRSMGMPGVLSGRVHLEVSGKGTGSDPKTLVLDGPGRVEDLVVEGKALSDRFGLSEYLLGPEAAPTPTPTPTGGGIKDFFKNLGKELRKELGTVVRIGTAKVVAELVFPGAEEYLKGMLRPHRYPMLDLRFTAGKGWMGLSRFAVRDRAGVFEGRAQFHMETLDLVGELSKARFDVGQGHTVLVTGLPIRGKATAPSIDPKVFLSHLKLQAPPTPTPSPAGPSGTTTGAAGGSATGTVVPTPVGPPPTPAPARPPTPPATTQPASPSWGSR